MNLKEWFELVRKTAIEAMKDAEKKITTIEIKGVDMAAGKELANTIGKTVDSGAKILKDAVESLGDSVDKIGKDAEKVVKDIVKNISNKDKPDTTTVTFDENGNIIEVDRPNKKKKRPTKRGN